VHRGEKGRWLVLSRVLVAAPVLVNVEKVVTDAFVQYRALVNDMVGAAEESPERGQAVMAGVFETIPADRQGRATVTLDLQKMLSFVGAELPRGLDGSGGPLVALFAEASAPRGTD
jgi:hypothetical protein